ncbi:SDR family oxidoreductase [Kitasatospora sp. RG8]|uniref:SDR family oxidoreductase n=1 Tax=Kitasatospora sp. RG8 TaxID=2820815 RepID=UPI001ADF9F86|nr:SDR family oxidoreductase [Kitasatospora sp. RG8]MBP0449144.1 SDR family oxidoreductase [Kitasatospora sp. RG8]
MTFRAHPNPRTVVITGASAGIGRACARAFATDDHRLVLVARGAGGLRAAASEAEAAGSPVRTIPADVADPDACEAVATEAEAEFGPVDAWVNDALVAVFAPFTEISPAEYRRVTEVTDLGYVNATRAALRRMLPRDHGTVVQVGSVIAHRGVPLQTAYSRAEHALQGWHEALRCELQASGSGVRVTMGQLPAVNTPQFDWVLNRMRGRARPVPPVHQPEVAARAVRYAADHPRRREYWVGARTAATLAANAVAPGLLDRCLARTGFDAQQEDRPRRADDPVNLWAPVNAVKDRGARGRFGSEARGRSFQPWASQHHGLLAAGLLVTAAGALSRGLQ